MPYCSETFEVQRGLAATIVVAICILIPAAGLFETRAETFEIFPSTANCSEELENVANSLQPGDELILRGGTYSQECRRSFSVDGTAAQPIVIRAADGEIPIVTRPDYSQNNLEIDRSTHLIVRGIHFLGGSTAIRIIGGNNVTIEDCEISETGNNAVTLNSGNTDSMTIRRNHIHHTGLSGGDTEGEGVYAGCNNAACRVSNSLFEGNYIHHLRGTSNGGNDGIEVKVGSYGNVIRNNVIHDTTIGTRYPCILVYGGDEVPNIVEGNAVWNCGEAIQAISDAIVRNNVVLNSGTGISSSSHAQVSERRNVTIVNNTIYGHDDECLYLRWSGASDMTLANNAVYCPGGRALDASGLGGASITVESNFVEGSMAGGSVDGSEFISGGSAAAAFRDAPGFDLWPAAGSALRGAAAASHAPALDFNETPRTAPYDGGAYETEGLAQNPGWPLQSGFKDAAAPDDTPPTVPQGLSTTARGESRIDLAWSASSDAESGVAAYVVYRDDVEVARTASTSFEDEGLAESTTYGYRIAAVNGSGLESAPGATVAGTTLSDSSPPELVSVAASGDPSGVTVVFSEPVAAASATNAGNYSIDPGIAVSGASLGGDLRTVTLLTSPHAEGVVYTLGVGGVTDRAATPNAVAAGTEATYVYTNALAVTNLVVGSGRAYEVAADLQAGSTAYIDRDFTYASVPAAVLGALHIRTANNDKNSEGDVFLSFEVNQGVTVYVAHDNRYENKPAWLGAFADSQQDLSVGGGFSLYREDFPTGTVVLGGNVSPGETESNSMYTVIVVPNPDANPDAPPDAPTQLRLN